MHIKTEVGELNKMHIKTEVGELNKMHIKTEVGGLNKMHIKTGEVGLNKMHIKTEVGLNINALEKLVAHLNFIVPKTQLDYYIDNDSSPEILKYVGLQGKTFGEKYMEPIAREFFNMEKRTNSSHDHSKNNKLIEQKSARYHANGSDFKWQHIEMNHEWDFLLLTGLEFNSIVFYIATRKIVEQLIEEGIITGQGKKDDNGVASPQQAYWFQRTDFKKKSKSITDYFTVVSSEEELVNYIEQSVF
jgi:hypothetical protein